jgi:GxxExxY protein
MKEEHLTEQIIGCCFQVHRALGPGFHEKTYQRALQLALKQARVTFEAERRFPVRFQDTLVGEFQADLVVGKQVVVELKAVAGIMPRVFESQVVSYLKASKLSVGLLVNFGNRSCEVKRLVA